LFEKVSSSIEFKDLKEKEKEIENPNENQILENDEEMSRMLMELQEIVKNKKIKANQTFL
jgi:hypothetical protein